MKYMSVDVDGLSYYNLRIPPFQQSPDPRFLWLGGAHREALDALTAGVRDNRGLLLLTGDVGTGKTTLTNALIEGLGGEVIVGKVPFPTLEPLEFFAAVANAYKLTGAVESRETFGAELGRFLTEAAATDRRVLLVIDEAQSLSRAVFEEIGHLASDGGPLNILLVGQSELRVTLWGTGSAALGRRVAVERAIAPLTANEVGEYVRHRLRVAGSERDLFGADAIHEIFALSEGIPRVINTTCGLALASGSRRGAETIGSGIIRDCAKGLGMPHRSHPQIQSRDDGVPAPRAVSGAGAKRSWRSALYVSALGVVLVATVVTGYLLYPAGRRETDTTPRPAESRDAVREETPPPPPIDAGDKVIQPTPVGKVDKDAPSREPAAVSPALTSAPRHVEPVPASAPRNQVKAPPGRGAAEEGAKPAAAKGTGVPRDEDASAPETPGPTSRARGATHGEARARAGGGPAEDPAAIIDWLLNEYVPGRE